MKKQLESVKNNTEVVPTVNWGLENTFDFCFNGIEKGSVVAVSTYMVSEHGNYSDQKEFFMAGYNEMMKRIEPELIICYHHPFPEMTGNILYIDYDLSSWQHYNDDLEKTYLKITNSFIKPKYFYGSILPYTKKGSGSAFGGEWKPAKEADERFLGEPGEIKRTLIPGKHGGYYVDTKIGDDGRAIKERHYTDHLYPNKHSSPHDHPVDWSKGVPKPDSKNRINYFDGKIPEFKGYKEALAMINYIPYDPERNRFKTISEFKFCMECGGEVEIIWKGKSYSITHPDGVINIGEGYYTDENGVARNVESNEPCNYADRLSAETPDGILEYVIDGDKLRDIITKVEVSSRTI